MLSRWSTWSHSLAWAQLWEVTALMQAKNQLNSLLCINLLKEQETVLQQKNAFENSFKWLEKDILNAAKALFSVRRNRRSASSSASICSFRYKRSSLSKAAPTQRLTILTKWENNGSQKSQTRSKYRLAHEDNHHVHRQPPASVNINTPHWRSQDPCGACYQNTTLKKYIGKTIV